MEVGDVNVIIESRIIGSFLGYAPGIVHRLDDASEWEQVCPTREYVYQERPGCRIFVDCDRIWIMVEGTNGVAEVRPYMRMRWGIPGP